MDIAKSKLTTTSGAKLVGFKMGKCLGFLHTQMTQYQQFNQLIV
jgi:hypothetical protein